MYRQEKMDGRAVSKTYRFPKRFITVRSKEQSCHCKVLASHYIRWEVVRMKFDFKDLMAFGMFILALLTFIIKFCQ